MLINFEEMSNSEIGIKLKELENEYNALQTKLKQGMAKLMELNDEFIKGTNILNKRTRGKI